MPYKKGYRLVPKEVPSRRRSGFYQDIVMDFVDGGEKSAFVEGTGKNPVTLVQGLRKALDADGLGTIGVVQRGQKVFLFRED